MDHGQTKRSNYAMDYLANKYKNYKWHKLYNIQDFVKQVSSVLLLPSKTLHSNNFKSQVNSMKLIL